MNRIQFLGDDLKMIESHFHALIVERNGGVPSRSGVSTEMPVISNQTSEEKYEWYAVPGMYGGFAYRLTERDGRPLLISESWSRVVGGSGQRHEITTDGRVLLEEGFV